MSMYGCTIEDWTFCRTVYVMWVGYNQTLEYLPGEEKYVGQGPEAQEWKLNGLWYDGEELAETLCDAADELGFKQTADVLRDVRTPGTEAIMKFLAMLCGRKIP